MTTNQTERVSAEELDQMIWKLERDGMTPKMLSLMRELREVRRAVTPTDDERIMAIEGISPQFKPVADLYGITSPTGSETSFTFDAIEAANFIEGGWSCQEYVELERYQAAMTNQSEQVLDMVNSPVIPDGWIPVSERMPDPKSELRVCVYTPTPHEDIRYRFVPASLFKAVCRDATHWHYMSAPKEVG